MMLNTEAKLKIKTNGSVSNSKNATWWPNMLEIQTKIKILWGEKKEPLWHEYLTETSPSFYTKRLLTERHIATLLLKPEHNQLGLPSVKTKRVLVVFNSIIQAVVWAQARLTAPPSSLWRCWHQLRSVCQWGNDWIKTMSRLHDVDRRTWQMALQVAKTTEP